MTPNQLPAKTQPTEKAMEFVPLGATDSIKLSIKIVRDVVAVPTRSGATPSDRDCIRFMMLCQAQRLNPFAGDCFMTGYDSKNGPVFSLITSHVAFLKRAESCDDYEGMESGVIILQEDGTVIEREGDFKLPDEQCVGGWARVYRKGRRVTYRRLSIEAMKPAYETSFWGPEKAPGQIVKCAEADALRATFPTLLGCVYTSSEMADAMLQSATPRVQDMPLVGDATPRALPEQTHGEPVAMTQRAAEPELLSQQAPAPAPASEQAGASVNHVVELAKVVEGAGYTFDQWKQWGAKSENVPDVDAMQGWTDVHPTIARRLVRSRGGMMTQIGQMFGGAK